MDFALLLQEWDGETLITRFDHRTGAWIFIAIHSTRLGPAAGGTRMKRYASPGDALRDAMRLSEGMTYKFAVPGIAMGGGKAVIALPDSPDTEDREGLLRRYGSLIRQLGGLYNTGPDVGTSSRDMDIIAETGSPFVHGRSPEQGGGGDSGPATALGVFTAIEVVCQTLFGDPSAAGKHVLVQGAGSVGASLIDRLLAAGASVSVSDVDPSVLQRLIARGCAVVALDSVYDVACDIFSPCALGGILNRDSIPRLRCRAVVGAANNQLASPEDADALRLRGILYAPDYVLNIGGAMWLLGVEQWGMTAEATLELIQTRVRETLNRIIGEAQAHNISTDAAARRLAEERLTDAKALSPARESHD
jgi:leucine dehydrogenase